ncbi:DUF7674 family protein [Daejeonella oryzae]|uniref:DUF7674 family protein n=1 Tax=Daejeonella oryzae TaxID=1122943 RepID=UPI000409062F|nr:hypothetical protein [Daejeonella oryzae]
MINDEQICELLKNEVPEISKALKGKGSKSCIAGLKLLTTHTARLIEKGSIDGVRKFFLLAEELIEIGSQLVKSVLTVQFLISIYPMLKAETVQTQQLKEILKRRLLCQYRYSVNMDKW